MSGIEQLPAELTERIAVGCDAVSLLRLSATCRNLRAFCFDSRIFRKIITDSQRHLWARDTLDIDAIARRCEGNAALWARYAVADHEAYMVSLKPDDQFNPHRTLDWAPELFLVGHPFLYASCWRQAHILCGLTQAKGEWSVALSLLAQQEPEVQREAGPISLVCTCTGGQHPSPTFVQSLCYTIVALDACLPFAAPRPTTRRRQNIATLPVLYRLTGPATYSATHGYLRLPRVSDMEMRPSRLHKALPLPFTGGLDDWKEWTRQHCMAMVDEITDGTWQGYYTYFVPHTCNVSARSDLPMMNIRFRHERVAVDHDSGSVDLIAEDCRDGVGIFKVKGSIPWQGERPFTFSGFKAYYNAADPARIRFGWTWSLKVTSFGLVGYWGQLENSKTRFRKMGTVWLWKAT